MTRPLGGLVLAGAIAASTLAVGVAAAVPSGVASLQSAGQAPSIRVLPIRGNVYLLSGGGVNIVASVGRDGVVLVDSGSSSHSATTLAAVEDLSRRVTASPMPAQPCVGRSLGCPGWSSAVFLPTTAGPPPPRPIIGIINTSDDEDHVGGNAVIAAAGHTFGVRNLTSNSEPGAWVLAHENASLRLTRAEHTDLAASETYFGRDKKLNFINGEGVVVTHLPGAHTDGDSVVYFRGSDVLAVGDILNMTSYPVIDLERGGSVQGVVDGLNWMLDVAVVEHMMEGGTMIVPGHGRLIDSADLAYYRDMMTIMRDRVRAWRERGKSLDEMVAARITRDYDGRFGRNPSWTPRQFVEAVYRSLDVEP